MASSRASACTGGAAASIAKQAKNATRSAGFVGEQPNGHLGALPSAPASAGALVRQINIRRRAKYAQAASRDSTSIEAVASWVGTKRITRLPSGESFRGPDAQWREKP